MMNLDLATALIFASLAPGPYDGPGRATLRRSAAPKEGWPCPKDATHPPTRKRYCTVCRARTEPK